MNPHTGTTEEKRHAGMGEFGTSPDAISYQYDVGNDFFALWLDDDTMSYSCALWDDDETLDLAAAQRRKIEYHIGAARAANAHRVLDVGCGWGGVLRTLVEHHGVSRAVGLTLSRTQYEWINDLGVPGVEVRLESWEDHEPMEPYDAIISIGSFEHFSRPDLTLAEQLEAYRAFFARCYQWLQPGGHLSLQTMAIGDASPRLRSAFTHYSQQYTPESAPPFIEEAVLAASPWFALRTARCDGEMYARTFQAWLGRLTEQRDEILRRYGPAIYKRFRQMLRAAATLFERGHLTLYRLALERRSHPRLSPLADALGFDGAIEPTAASPRAPMDLLAGLVSSDARLGTEGSDQ